MDLERVFPFRKGLRAPRARLFCLPHAGGSAVLYRGWTSALGADVEVVPVELPGRGLRMTEKPYESSEEIVDHLASAMTPLLGPPVALFGHSMGGHIAFEIAKALGPRVQKLFVSASPAPGVDSRQRVADLPDHLFKEHLRELGGTPPELLEDDEFLSFVLPMLRADFRVNETYRPNGQPAPCSITAFAATRDRQVDLEDVRRWEDVSPSGFRLVTVDDGHFFTTTQQEILLDVIRCDLDAALASALVATTRGGSR